MQRIELQCDATAAGSEQVLQGLRRRDTRRQHVLHGVRQQGAGVRVRENVSRRFSL